MTKLHVPEHRGVIAKSIANIVARGGDLRVKGCGARFCIAGGYCADAEDGIGRITLQPYPHSGSRGLTDKLRIPESNKDERKIC